MNKTKYNVYLIVKDSIYVNHIAIQESNDEGSKVTLRIVLDGDPNKLYEDKNEYMANKVFATYIPDGLEPVVTLYDSQEIGDYLKDNINVLRLQALLM